MFLEGNVITVGPGSLLVGAIAIKNSIEETKAMMSNGAEVLMSSNW